MTAHKDCCIHRFMIFVLHVVAVQTFVRNGPIYRPILLRHKYTPTIQHGPVPFGSVRRINITTATSSRQFDQLHYSTRKNDEAISSETFTDFQHLTLRIPTLEDMEDIGALVATITLEDKNVAGGTILLTGDLGAGKTAFARGLLRSATGDGELLVTSPTYLLANTYTASAATEKENMNLELSGPNDQSLSSLNLDHVFSRCLSIVEWPMRLPDAIIPEERLNIDISIVDWGDDTHIGSETDTDSNDVPRILTLQPNSKNWNARLERIRIEGYVDDLLVEQ